MSLLSLADVVFTSSTHTVNRDWQAEGSCACARVADRGNSRGVVKQSTTREEERGRGGKKKPREAKQPGVRLGFSPPRNNYARLPAVGSPQVSAPRSLNGSGYRAAFTDPQHQLQPLRFGKSCLFIELSLLSTTTHTRTTTINQQHHPISPDLCAIDGVFGDFISAAFLS